MAALPQRAEVVVIGGGVMGAATLAYLTARGCTDAVLIERDTLAAGSTSRSAGGFRAQFSDELNIRIALEAIRRLTSFEEEHDTSIDLKQWGYLFLLEEGAVEAFSRAVRLQQELGVPSRIVTPEEAGAIVPGVRTDDLAAATFCPMDGYCTPESVVQGYARTATRHGARVVQGCRVEAIEEDGGRVVGVRTDRGTVATDRVVCAAGVWSRELLGPLGIEVPIVAERRHVFLASGDDPLPGPLPLTIDFATGLYVHREGEGLLMGGRITTIEELATQALHRLPFVERLTVRPGWWGYYAMSPDHNAIVGAAHEPTGLVYATGFSGHGFQQGPVIGEHLAELVLDLPPTFDLSGLSLDRFAEGSGRPEDHVV